MFGDSETGMVAPGGLRGAVMNITPTMTERLRQEQAKLQERLAEVTAALTTIEAHPEVQQVVDALTKLHWLR